MISSWMKVCSGGSFCFVFCCCFVLFACFLIKHYEWLFGAQSQLRHYLFYALEKEDGTAEELRNQITKPRNVITSKKTKESQTLSSTCRLDLKHYWELEALFINLWLAWGLQEEWVSDNCRHQWEKNENHVKDKWNCSVNVRK